MRHAKIPPRSRVVYGLAARVTTPLRSLVTRAASQLFSWFLSAADRKRGDLPAFGATHLPTGVHKHAVIQGSHERAVDSVDSWHGGGAIGQSGTVITV